MKSESRTPRGDLRTSRWLRQIGIPAASLALLSGCERVAEPKFVVSPEVAALDAQLQQAVQQHLAAQTGTPVRPKLLGAEPEAFGGEIKLNAHLQHGAEVYRQNCQQCHGPSGDGAGPAAEYLSPKPRDYRKGVFKFTSTGYGNKPRREDLVRTVTRGVTGTSMPSFARLEKKDLDAVVDYVLALTHRGELEILLAAQADSDGELTDDGVQELAQSIVDQWRAADEQIVEPVVKMPAFTPESVAKGQEIFQKRECFKCHGRDGRGGLAGGIEVGVDAWGQKTAAADLTSGMLHGGNLPVDVYRRIHAGINGTPMPAFKDILAADPDATWYLVHYVLQLSDQRRHGVQFPAAVEPKPAPPVALDNPAEEESAQ
ncbi:MAG: c-type cytochrome [Pirellulales bacterium]|nr:c-type cytochrome [Pirellulales bacterium]